MRISRPQRPSLQKALRPVESLVKRIPGARRLASAVGWSARGRSSLLRLMPRGSIGAEIGVHEGDFSQQLLDVLQPAKLYLIDPWVYESGGIYVKALYGGKAEGGQAELDARYRSVVSRFEAEIATGRVEVHRTTSERAAEHFELDSLDWVYIDGNHLYDFVKRDLELYTKRVKPGGLICGDDYVDGGWWEGGVTRAVDEFLDTAAVELVTLFDGQYVLQKDVGPGRPPNVADGSTP